MSVDNFTEKSVGSKGATYVPFGDDPPHQAEDSQPNLEFPYANFYSRDYPTAGYGQEFTLEYAPPHELPQEFSGEPLFDGGWFTKQLDMEDNTSLPRDLLRGAQYPPGHPLEGQFDTEDPSYTSNSFPTQQNQNYLPHGSPPSYGFFPRGNFFRPNNPQYLPYPDYPYYQQLSQPYDHYASGADYSDFSRQSFQTPTDYGFGDQHFNIQFQDPDKLDQAGASDFNPRGPRHMSGPRNNGQQKMNQNRPNNGRGQKRSGPKDKNMPFYPTTPQHQHQPPSSSSGSPPLKNKPNSKSWVEVTKNSGYGSKDADLPETVKPMDQPNPGQGHPPVQMMPQMYPDQRMFPSSMHYPPLSGYPGPGGRPNQMMGPPPGLHGFPGVAPGGERGYRTGRGRGRGQKNSMQKGYHHPHHLHDPQQDGYMGHMHHHQHQQKAQYQKTKKQKQRVQEGNPVTPETEPSLSFLGPINPVEFDCNPQSARFFVIKSYTEDDVFKSVKYGVWASTDTGNKRLDKAYKEFSEQGIIYLFFSVNSSTQFCGIAQMTSPLDFSKKSSHWSQDKWNGSFQVKWIFIKDISNSAFRHITLANNEGKPITNSRDTQEVLLPEGIEFLKIFHAYKLKTSLLDDFNEYCETEKTKELAQLKAQQNGHPQQDINNSTPNGTSGASLFTSSPSVEQLTQDTMKLSLNDDSGKDHQTGEDGAVALIQN